ncbi:MAG: disulfide bond formation protein B [Alphaproteobacteria bacterium]
MPSPPNAPRTVWLTLGLGALAVVAVSMVLGRLVDAAPCHLCIAQRALLLLVVPAALMAALAWRNVAGLLAGVASVAVAATGVVVAARQSWLERQTPEVAAGCAGSFAPTPTERAAAWLGDAVPWLFRVEGTCDAMGPTFLGLSFANAGLATFAVVAGAAALTLVRWRPHAGRRAHRPPSEEVPRAEAS